MAVRAGQIFRIKFYLFRPWQDCHIYQRGEGLQLSHSHPMTADLAEAAQAIFWQTHSRQSGIMSQVCGSIHKTTVCKNKMASAWRIVRHWLRWRQYIPVLIKHMSEKLLLQYAMTDDGQEQCMKIGEAFFQLRHT